MILLTLGDLFGYTALVFIASTAVLMLLRKTLLRYTRNLELLRRVHLYVATLGGAFLALHVAYFVTYPVTSAVVVGYASAAVAVFVWLTGTAFLERLRDSLFFHGSISIVAIGLMVIHAMSSGTNVPAWMAEVMLTATAGVAFWKASHYARNMLR